jgi:hypothetical protein
MRKGTAPPMAKQLTYADALRILGKNDSEVLDLAEKLADGGLGMVGVPDLFGARGALVSKGRQALEGIRGKLKGESRLSRTQKIEAAHRILLIVAFFEAVDTTFTEIQAPFALADLNFTREEQTAQLGRVLSRTDPTLSMGWDARSRHFHFAEVLFWDFATFFLGLAVAEEHGITSRNHGLLKRAARIVPERGGKLYEESYRRLAAEIPEFGMWVHLREHTRTRESVDSGFGELRRLLEKTGSGRKVDARRRELAAGYQAVLRRPVLRSDHTPAGVRIPALEDAYVQPRGRTGRMTPTSMPSTETWWATRPVIDDLQPVVAAHLVHPSASQYPVVVLGHPGAGKSKFTEVLAAQLPSADFLPIRVELRTVRPNSPLHLQIEEGLTAALHTQVPWRELVENADGALPVIILDGFDELLQATGVDRSDYLERVQEFQHQQEALGQPVAVIVTSRTVVADRARIPVGTMVIRLEPFDDTQIRRMLEAWNHANADTFADSALEPLDSDVLLQYRELAEQPLLLLMLLLYDAEGNALRNASRALSHGQLYERLLTEFAEREVRKHRAHLSERDLGRAVEEELRRLEVAAAAMFNRGSQSVSADELDQDLSVLLPSAAERPTDTDLHGRIAPAHQVLGRFFFVHESRAQAARGAASTFEFLHATFGEYLVARAVVTALAELVEDRARSLRRRGGHHALDDGELFASGSFAALAGRAKVVEFLAEILRRNLDQDADLRREYTQLLLELLREAPFPAPNRGFARYEPIRLSMSAREGRYTANLLTLLVLVREEPMDLRELFPSATDTWHTWRGMVALWRSMPSSQWFGVLDTIRVRHHGYWKSERPRTTLEREDGSPVNVGECVGFELRADIKGTPATLDPYELVVEHSTVTSTLLRSMALQANGTASRMVLMMLPYLRHVSLDLGTWSVVGGTADPWIQAHEFLRLKLEPTDADPEQRLRSYQRLLSGRTLRSFELMVLRQAEEDLRSGRFYDDTMRVQGLLGVITDHLDRLTAVAPRSEVRPEEIERVLDSLAPDLDRQLVSDVLSLVWGAGAAGGSAPPVGTDPFDTVTNPYFEGSDAATPWAVSSWGDPLAVSEEPGGEEPIGEPPPF